MSTKIWELKWRWKIGNWITRPESTKTQVFKSNAHGYTEVGQKLISKLTHNAEPQEVWGIWGTRISNRWDTGGSENKRISQKPIFKAVVGKQKSPEWSGSVYVCHVLCAGLASAVSHNTAHGSELPSYIHYLAENYLEKALNPYFEILMDDSTLESHPSLDTLWDLALQMMTSKGNWWKILWPEKYKPVWFRFQCGKSLKVITSILKTRKNLYKLKTNHS